MSSCAAPAGSPCRTGRGRVAAQYHTARFRLVPHLAKALSVPVPPLRRPGSAWAELPRPPAAGTAPAGHVRIGYARASTIRQSLDTQTDSLRAAGVTRISPDARDVQPLLALAAALAALPVSTKRGNPERRRQPDAARYPRPGRAVHPARLHLAAGRRRAGQAVPADRSGHTSGSAPAAGSLVPEPSKQAASPS
jgi:hypothetical protein